MNRNTLKIIISAAVLIFLFLVALSIIKIAVRVLLPIAILVIAGYIIYMLVTKKR